MSGRAATKNVIPGHYALSVGKPDLPAPPKWEWHLLTDIAVLETGHTPSRKKASYWGGSIPWIGIKDAREYHGRQIHKTLQSVTQLGLENSAARLLPAGTVCLSRTASIGYSLVMAQPMATSQDFVNWVCSEAIDPRFLLHLFIAEKESLLRFGKGTTHKTIYFPEAKALHVCTPPVPEQRRIVAKIEALQERSRKAREALSEVGPLLEQFRQSLLAAAFRGSLTADWRAENPDVEPAGQFLAHIRQERRERWEQAELAKYEAKGKQPPKGWKEKYHQPEPVDDSELPELPEGWCWEPLELLCPAEAPVVYGIILPGPHVPDGVPFVRPADISSDGEIEFEKLPRTSPEIAKRYHRASLEAGDLIFSVVGTIGKWLIAPPELAGGNITQSSVRIRPFQPISAIFVLRCLQSPPVVRQMERLQFGNAVQRLNVEHMRRLAIPIPPVMEAQKLSKLVESGLNAIRRQFTSVEESKSELALLDQSILAKAFQGELVSQDPNDEPASVLLDRIRKQREAAGQKAKKPSRRKRAERPTRTRPTATDPPSVSQCVLLLLKAWGRPVSFHLLEAGVLLMLEPALQDAVIKPRRGRKKARTEAGPRLTGMDQIYLSLTSKAAIKRVGKHAYELNSENESILKLLNESSLPRAENAIAALEAMMQREKMDEPEAGMAVAQMVSQPHVATANV